MAKRGIVPKDGVTFCCANTLDTTIPMLAAFYLGAVVSNLDKSLSMRHARYLLGLVVPKMIFVDETSLPLIEESLVDAKFKPEIVVFGTSDKYTTFADFLAPAKDEKDFKPVATNPDDEALILFSSGTTGLPKAITHSSRTFLLLTLQLYQVGMRDPVLHFTSFYWITANMMLTCSFKSGAYRVFARESTGDDVFKIIEKHKIAYIFMAPIITYKLTSVENPERYDTSSLKVIYCVGTPIAPLQLEKMNNLFKNARTTKAFGMSEVGVVTFFDPEFHEDLARRKMASTGVPGPGVTMKVVDIDTEELQPPYRKGEFRIKAPSMMIGYYRGDFSQAFDSDGFLKTGDVGYYDEDDCVYVIDRIKEMFKYQSWHIVPSSIEAALLEHPEIKEAAVFGLPAHKDGEVPAACIVLKEGSTANEEDIDDFLKDRVSDRERLRGGVTFVQALAKTPTGKLSRLEMRNFVLNSRTK